MELKEGLGKPGINEEDLLWTRFERFHIQPRFTSAIYSVTSTEVILRSVPTEANTLSPARYIFLAEIFYFWKEDILYFWAGFLEGRYYFWEIYFRDMNIFY